MNTAINSDALQKTEIAVKDIKNALFELGILESFDDTLELEQTLRDDLGLDSQEVVSLIEIISSLITSGEPINDENFKTVSDLVGYLASNRATWLSTETDYVMQDSVVIEQDIHTVFGYIFNYEKWPEVLDHVAKIETDYNDNKFQSFKMHIDELGSNEHYYVQSWRYVNKEQFIIDFSQPLPPKSFLIHQGGWRFRTIAPNKTELISYHSFSLKEGADIETAFILIRKHIQAALKTWSQHSMKEPSHG